MDIAMNDPAVEEDMRVRSRMEHLDYVRFQVELDDTDSSMDNTTPEALGRLKSETEKFLNENRNEIHRVAEELLLPRSPQCGRRPGEWYDRPEGPRRHEGESGAG